MAVQDLSDVGTLVKLIVSALVDYPEEVEVEEVVGTNATMLEVRIDRRDMGKLIGRRGRTANALRELLVDFGGRAGRRYLLEILED
jgi:hypothetical protein